jgi:hypothetical protein
MSTFPASSILLLALGVGGIDAEDFGRWEAGAQLVRLDLDTIGESPLGAGGRVSYLVNRSFAFEAEGNHFLKIRAAILGTRRFWPGRGMATGLVRSGFLRRPGPVICVLEGGPPRGTLGVKIILPWMLAAWF